MTAMPSRSPLPRQLLLLAAGLLVFATGVLLARAWLPEWRTARLPEKRQVAERFRELAARTGVRLASGEPRISLTLPEKDDDARRKLLDSLDPDAVANAGGGLLIEAKHQAFVPPSRDEQSLEADFLPNGDPWSLRLGIENENGGGVGISARQNVSGLSRQREELARLLLRPGESLGPGVPGKDAQRTTFPVTGSRPPQQVVLVTVHPEGSFSVTRQPGQTGTAADEDSNLPEILLIVVPLCAGIATSLVLFLVLLGKRRIDLLGPVWIGGFLFAVSAAALLYSEPSWKRGLLGSLGALFLALWAYLLWSVGESFLRAVTPGTAVSLDALRAGRLGPRGGRSLLLGIASGAALAGLHLGALALAAHLPGALPGEASIHLPLYEAAVTPFFTGVILAAAVAIALGLADRFLPARWAPWGATLIAGLAVPFSPLYPIGWGMAAGLVIAGLLVLTGRRAGLAGLLAAAVCFSLFQAAAFAAFHFSWFPIAFAVSAGTPVLLLALGLVGMGRPEWAERERVRQPAFIRRMEEEQRLSYEMDLLARMQLGLLPASLPEVPGWEIAVRSLIATEAGGDLYDFLTDDAGDLWIAAGDVAGHGYSCAIVQAMTAAALTSIITAERTPSEVLQGVDRVIRRGGSHRNFASLALVRLDPATGQVTMSNAGHPFPLLLAHDGEVEEISLPSLPLGQGPARRYADHRFEIPPGGALVFCSDGLFEATDLQEVQYGYERPRELLRDLGERPAPEILEALLADWRGYMRSDGPPSDDTTVLVVKRKAALSSAA